ncbi:MAG TPA: hypothetical protein VFX96_10950 [Pyrinomonadaceae bacterium]|nr:hypothetical protein [Pyrinomonadaceae bacterium]
MRSTKFFIACAVALLFVGADARAQHVFSDDEVEYTLELPNTTWKPTARADGAHQHVDFIYGERSDGYLKIRREVVEQGQTPADVLDRERDFKLRIITGYVGGKEERFAGRLEGVTFGYEYTSGGKQMAGRVYYLQADGRTVYTLNFTGQREKLQRIRNQTDAIARSFRLK